MAHAHITARFCPRDMRPPAVPSPKEGRNGHSRARRERSKLRLALDLTLPRRFPHRGPSRSIAASPASSATLTTSPWLYVYFEWEAY